MVPKAKLCYVISLQAFNMSKLPLKMSNGSHTLVHLAYIHAQPRTVIRVKSQLIRALCA